MLYEPRHEKTKPVFLVSDINLAEDQQKRARGLKFWI